VQILRLSHVLHIVALMCTDVCDTKIRPSFFNFKPHLLTSVQSCVLLMRYLRLLCLLIVKMAVCNALLPAPTFRFQFAAHVCSPHSSGPMKRIAIVITAPPDASGPVCCCTSAAAHALCRAASMTCVSVCSFLSCSRR
jgi:hypothetical protein